MTKPERSEGDVAAGMALAGVLIVALSACCTCGMLAAAWWVLR